MNKQCTTACPLAGSIFANAEILVGNGVYRGPTCRYRIFRWSINGDFLTCGRGRLILCVRRRAEKPGPRFRFAASVMKPAPFKYIAATSLEHALALKAEHGDDANFLAGGQSLIPAMNFRLARPAILIDINGIEALAGVAFNGTTRIGALTRYQALQRDPVFSSLVPLIGEALPHIAHPQIRNR